MFFAFHFNSTHCSHICKSIFHSPPPPRSPGDRAACQQKICTSFGAVSGAKGAGSWFRPLKDVHSLRRAIPRHLLSPWWAHCMLPHPTLACRVFLHASSKRVHAVLDPLGTGKSKNKITQFLYHSPPALVGEEGNWTKHKKK